jgi:hypothetical protein
MEQPRRAEQPALLAWANGYARVGPGTGDLPAEWTVGSPLTVLGPRCWG